MTKSIYDLYCVPSMIAARAPKQRFFGQARKFADLELSLKTTEDPSPYNAENSNTTPQTTAEKDLGAMINHQFDAVLFGPRVQENNVIKLMKDHPHGKQRLTEEIQESKKSRIIYPQGQMMRAETFMGRAAVHFPPQELFQPGNSRLLITKDKMQTAINAYAIFLYGTVTDIMNIPPDYILRSARTIAMMSIAREKLAATWIVVKGLRKPVEIDHKTLEMYRPLFRYLNGREIARLNLSDPKILTYIGTHAELTRHQMGIVASTYVKTNPHWLEAKYLNLMNNLLCGMPINLVRKITPSTYLQLTRQLFLHIRACDSLQRRFYLHHMSRPEVLGKPCSWSPREVARLGLLLVELEGPEFASINPEAINGITSQVMMKIPIEVLQHMTETQLKYLDTKPLNILSRRMKAHQDRQSGEHLAYGMRHSIE